MNGNLSNFAGTTLTGGAYAVTGTLQFNGANIVTNAANITLTGGASKIVDEHSVNALTNLTTNSGSFSLTGGANFTTAGGSFTNSGTVLVATGTTLTVGNGGNTSIAVNYTQSGGMTTVDGTLKPSASTVAPVLTLSGGSLFGGGTIDYGVIDSGVVTPGDSSAKTGKLAVAGTYTQNSGGALDISIGGTTVGKQFDQLNVTNAASLTGTLNISLLKNFVPTVGSTFDILNASSLTGTFSAVTGTAINGTEHFSVTYNANDVVLTVVSGASDTGSVAGASTPVHRDWKASRRFTIAKLPASSAPAIASVSPLRIPANVRVPVEAFKAAPSFTATNLNAGIASAPYQGRTGSNISQRATHTSRLECGVDVKSLLHLNPRHLLRGMWDESGNQDGTRIGYIALSH